MKYHKPTDKYYAVFYCLIALGLFIWGYYKKEPVFLIGAVLVGLVSYYWIAKCWRFK